MNLVDNLVNLKDPLILADARFCGPNTGRDVVVLFGIRGRDGHV